MKILLSKIRNLSLNWVNEIAAILPKYSLVKSIKLLWLKSALVNLKIAFFIKFNFLKLYLSNIKAFKKAN